MKKLIFNQRVLPTSNILSKRKEQILQMIQNWDQELEADILAENFYLDKSREHRKAEIQEIFENAGETRKVEKIEPINQLRGEFKIIAENGTISIFFTLTPEKDPKVQALHLSFKENNSK